MEPREPVNAHKFADFEYEPEADGTAKERFAEVRSMTEGFYTDWVKSGRDIHGFFDLLRATATTRNILNISVAIRSLEQHDDPEFNEMSDANVLRESWYESFLQCTYLAEACMDMPQDDLLELRDYALSKLVTLNEDGRPDEPLSTYAAELSWYSHVANGAAIAANLDPAEAYEYANQYVRNATQGMSPLEHMEFLAYRLLGDKVNLLTEDTSAIRESARYVAEGLDDDESIDSAIRSFASIKYINSTIDAMYRSGKDMHNAWRGLVDIIHELYPKDEPESEVEVLDFETFKPLEVDWEVLPPGELQDFAREIADGKPSNKNVYIDPARLKTLEVIRLMWGKDNAFFAKGSMRNRQVRRINGVECPDEYIMLILQDKDDNGNIIEHAVAESPIAGEHAMYIYRQDVNPGVSWREVMSIDKQEARKLGARPVKHPSTDTPEELIEIMTNRAEVLLTATPEEFVKIEFNGSRFRISKSLAIKAFASLQVAAYA